MTVNAVTGILWSAHSERGVASSHSEPAARRIAGMAGNAFTHTVVVEIVRAYPFAMRERPDIHPKGANIRPLIP